MISTSSGKLTSQHNRCFACLICSVATTTHWQTCPAIRGPDEVHLDWLKHREALRREGNGIFRTWSDSELAQLLLHYRTLKDRVEALIDDGSWTLQPLG